MIPGIPKYAYAKTKRRVPIVCEWCKKTKFVIPSLARTQRTCTQSCSKLLTSFEARIS